MVETPINGVHVNRSMQANHGVVQVVKWQMNCVNGQRKICAQSSNFCEQKTQNLLSIHKWLVSFYGPEVRSVQQVQKWCYEFPAGRTTVTDDAHSDWPWASSLPLTKWCEWKNRRVTGWDIRKCAAAGGSRVNYQDQQKTGTHDRLDESYSQIASMLWKHAPSAPRKKVKTSVNTRNVLAKYLLGYACALLFDFVKRCVTVNAAAYQGTSQHLKDAIHRWRTGLLTRDVMILHDNARPHVAMHVSCWTTGIQKLSMVEEEKMARETTVLYCL